jgi:ABC-type molybdenum transport system ATPase subunit/photorepair protein PhrA
VHRSLLVHVGPPVHATADAALEQVREACCWELRRHLGVDDSAVMNHLHGDASAHGLLLVLCWCLARFGVWSRVTAARWEREHEAVEAGGLKLPPLPPDPSGLPLHARPCLAQRQARIRAR